MATTKCGCQKKTSARFINCDANSKKGVARSRRPENEKAPHWGARGQVTMRSLVALSHQPKPYQSGFSRPTRPNGAAAPDPLDLVRRDGLGKRDRVLRYCHEASAEQEPGPIKLRWAHLPGHGAPRPYPFGGREYDADLGRAPPPLARRRRACVSTARAAATKLRKPQEELS